MFPHTSGTLIFVRERRHFLGSLGKTILLTPFFILCKKNQPYLTVHPIPTVIACYECSLHPLLAPISKCQLNYENEHREDNFIWEL